MPKPVPPAPRTSTFPLEKRSMNPGAAFRSHSDFPSSQGSLLRERRWPAALPPAPRASIYRQEGKKPGKGKLPLAAGAAQPQHSEDLRRKKKRRYTSPEVFLPKSEVTLKVSGAAHGAWYCHQDRAPSATTAGTELPLPLLGHRQPRHSSSETRRVPRRFYPHLLFSFIFTFF